MYYYLKYYLYEEIMLSYLYNFFHKLLLDLYLNYVYLYNHPATWHRLRGTDAAASDGAPLADAENSERVGDLPYERPRASARVRAINCGRPRRPRPREADAPCFAAAHLLPNRGSLRALPVWLTVGIRRNS